LLIPPEYDDARLSVMLERAKERSRVLRRQRLWRWLVTGVGGAGVAAAVWGLLAVLVPAAPAVAPGASSARQAAEAAYVISRIQRALSLPGGHDVVGYARTVLPPGSTWMPGAGKIGPGSVSGARSPGVIGSAISWWYGSTEETTGFSATGQRLLSARTATSAGGEVATVVVDYRDRTWWQGTSAVPAGQMRPGCAAQTPISTGDWPSFIRAELHCGQFRAAGQQRVDGITAIEVIQRQGSVMLWVNPATYLPARLVTGGQQPIQTNFRWLPATSAGRAQLAMPVPAGFREVQAPS
jgi:hypothetical protein